MKTLHKKLSRYQQFVKGGLHPTNARTAEMCKLVENSSCDVQIAFANELSLIFDKENIDDLRQSPAIYITQKLLQEANDETYFMVEPNIYIYIVIHCIN